MSISWTVGALKTAYDNRDHILGIWDKLVVKVLGPQYRIAIVGPGGIGKSVLLDHITGKAFAKNYRLPPRSVKPEPGRAKAGGNRMAMTVVPGQDSGPQIDTYEKVFDPENPVDGVVFVSGFGFETIRSKTARDYEIGSLGLTDLKSFRASKLAQEKAALDQVLERLRPALRAARKPTWMIVATTKSDLYQDEIAEAEAYYAPYNDSPFTELIKRFRSQVGTDNFEWDSLPVCAYLEDFEWNGEVAKSTLTPDQRNAYIEQMIRRLGELCR
jgi:GTPase SAR1 family protein